MAKRDETVPEALEAGEDEASQGVESRGTTGSRNGREEARANGEALEGPTDAPSSEALEVVSNGAVEGDPEAPSAAATGTESSTTGDPEVGAGELLSEDELARAASALVFASPDPLSERRLAQLLDGPSLPRLRQALALASERLAQSGLGLEMREIAGGWRILTHADLGEVVQRLFKARKAERISGAALETLAIVAYRQPVTKAEIEAIRGVQAGPILRTLVDKGFVRVAGRADVPGHPLQYGTTRVFLDRFGLAGLQELPRDAELAKD